MEKKTPQEILKRGSGREKGVSVQREAQILGDEVLQLALQLGGFVSGGKKIC